MKNLHKIEIADSKNGVLAFDLKDILEALPGFAAALIWHILALEAVGKGLRGEPMLATENRIHSSPHGIALRYPELQDFARAVQQTLNAIIVGIKEGHISPSLPLELPYEAPYISVEAIDSSVWVISSSDEGVIKYLKERFKETTLVTEASL